MSDSGPQWGKTIVWGSLSALCYAALYHYAEEFIRLAHTTVDACAVATGGKTVYLIKPDALECAARGGQMIVGNLWHVWAPIAVALAISYTHGTFTGSFWESLGFTAAKK